MAQSEKPVTEEPLEPGEAEGTPVEIRPANFVAGGSQFDTIAVNINFGIVEQFSEGLYSSPNKTFEELVTNSYDAGATRVWVSVPSNLSDESAKLAVIDDGESMDLSGLRGLWQIGESTRRSRPNARPDRKPVGKFGIGKLATYVLANELTYLCRRGNQYLATTMDYREVTGRLAEQGSVLLDVVELTKTEAKATLRDAIGDGDPVKTLFGSKAPSNWTAALMSDLKDRGRQLERGRLRWILSIALPLNPEFNLWLNDAMVESSKATGKKIWTFKIGVDDKRKNTSYANRATDDGVTLEHAGLITGFAEMYENPLPRGKAEELGRSHGIFVSVLRRLINITDETFGIDVELHHGVFTRFRMEVNSDALDEVITATRESIKESTALREVQEYLLSVFNAARSARTEMEKAHPQTLTASERIANPPPALSQAPLRRIVTRAFLDAGTDRLLAELVTGTDEMEGEPLELEGTMNLLEGITIEPRGVDERIASYDLSSRMIVVNRDHPFIDNYIDEKGAVEPLQLIAATELFTAVYLLDEATPTHVVRDVLDRRDAYLRALVSIYPRSAPVIARQLRDAVHSEKMLEDAMGDALAFLGFRVHRKSGSGRTDVLAVAHLGRQGEAEENRSYGIVCDAKSTSREEVIKADKVNPGPLRKHKKKENAKYILVVAPGYEGAGTDESSIAEYCTDGGITPITANDLARLIELYPTRSINPAVLETLFKTKHTPLQSKTFVDELEKNGVKRPRPPIDMLLGIIDDFSDAKAPVAIKGLPALLQERSAKRYDYTLEDVRAMIDGLRSLAPTGIWSDSEWVALQTSPDQVKDEIRSNLSELGGSAASDARKTFDITK
jgi:hypothetical protein